VAVQGWPLPFTILPTCKGQQSKNCFKLGCFTVEEGVDRLPQNVCN